MLQVAENKKKVVELGLKHLASGLNVKEKVQADDEPEFDREYVPGHDSLSEAEKEDEDIVVEQAGQKQKMMKMKQKKAKKVTNPVSRPITRSRTTAPLSTQVHDVKFVYINNCLAIHKLVLIWVLKKTHVFG